MGELECVNFADSVIGDENAHAGEKPENSKLLHYIYVKGAYNFPTPPNQPETKTELS
jgi:hypothetical protein